jgi:hypothetical protein
MKNQTQLVYLFGKKITDSVPEGSVLGHLLYLIYINDLSKITDGNAIPILFADEPSILKVPAWNFRNKMSNTFTCVNEWLKSNLSIERIVFISKPKINQQLK